MKYLVNWDGWEARSTAVEQEITGDIESYLRKELLDIYRHDVYGFSPDDLHIDANGIINHEVEIAEYNGSRDELDWVAYNFRLQASEREDRPGYDVEPAEY